MRVRKANVFPMRKLRTTELLVVTTATLVVVAFTLQCRVVSRNDDLNPDLRGYAPPKRFTPVPKKFRKTFWAQNTWKCAPVERAFRSRGFSMVEFEEAQFVVEFYEDKEFFKTAKPWQRYNHIPGADAWSDKVVDVFKAHEKTVGREMYFLPETFRLHLKEDRNAFWTRLRNGGFGSSWVLKKMDDDDAKLLPANSQELVDAIDRAKKKYADKKERYMVRQHVCNQLAWFDRKFHVRTFWYVASVDPLVVLYHDGYMRIGNFEDSTVDSGDGLKAPFQELGLHVNKHKQLSTHLGGIRDPVQHVRNQFKDILAKLVVAYKASSAFNPSAMSPENAFGFYGADFILDQDMDVWFMGLQMEHELYENHDWFLDMDNEMARGVVDVAEEIWHKEEEGLPLLPLKNVDSWEIVYADGWQYSFEGYERSMNKEQC